MRKFYNKCKRLYSKFKAAVVGVGVGVGSAVMASSAFAADADLATLYAAIDLAGLKANILAMLLVGIGITLLFVGYRLYKKGANKVA